MLSEFCNVERGPMMLSYWNGSPKNGNHKTHPKHILLPLEKLNKYRSSLGFSTQRSGRNKFGSGKYSSSLCSSDGVILTGVPLGITHLFPVLLSTYTRSSSGATRCWRSVAPGCMRIPSWITPVR